MKKLILLRGNSGSGKTTVEKLLQHKIGPNTMLISHDMVRMQILHVWSKEGIEKSQPLMIEHYWDIPFEETLIRHKTKPNCNDFGEEEMKRWWREKDFLEIIPQKILEKELSLEDAVNLIYRDVMG